MAIKARSGQAMMELAAGMFALALVLAALFTFSRYMLESLDEQRTLRSKAGRAAMASTGGDESYSTAKVDREVEVEPFAAEWLFPAETLVIDESVHMPAMREQKEQ